MTGRKLPVEPSAEETLQKPAIGITTQGHPPWSAFAGFPVLSYGKDCRDRTAQPHQEKKPVMPDFSKKKPSCVDAEVKALMAANVNDKPDPTLDPAYKYMSSKRIITAAELTRGSFAWAVCMTFRGKCVEEGVLFNIERAYDGAGKDATEYFIGRPFNDENKRKLEGALNQIALALYESGSFPSPITCTAKMQESQTNPGVGRLRISWEPHRLRFN